MKKVITKIEAQKKNKDRVNIYINDEFSFACSSELVYYHNLAKGKEVDEERILEIAEEDNYITAKSAALKYIERALKTRQQVIDYLLKKEYSEKTVKRVIEFMDEYKFVDDGYFAKAFASQNIRIEGRGNIRYKLIKKGISEELADNTLSNLSEEDETETAFKLASKRAAVLVKKERDVRKVKAKLNTFLVSKGYNFDIVSTVIRRIPFDDLYAEILEADSGQSPEEAAAAEEKKYEELLDLAKGRYEKLKRTEADSMKLKKKLYDFLLRNGYGYDEIKKAARCLIDGEDYI